jgi:3-phenylpropionate/trans-cinnamate dioxygenase ferredoxin component
MAIVETFVTIGKSESVQPGRMRAFSVDGKQILVANVGGTFFATQDLCTHDNGTLSDGELVDDEIECPRHGARFSAKTGEVRALPAMFPIKTYPIKVENGEIKVSLG